jgi:hypothetical protein
MKNTACQCRKIKYTRLFLLPLEEDKELKFITLNTKFILKLKNKNKNERVIFSGEVTVSNTTTALAAIQS